MINQPYDGKQGGNHAQNNSIGFDVDPTRKGILFEFRNDILTDPVRRAKLETDLIEILSQLQPTCRPPVLSSAPALDFAAAFDLRKTVNCLVVAYNEDPKVRVAFVAEHAGSELPEGLRWSSNDERFILSRDLHYDRHTLELTDHLARFFKTSMIATRLSKLVVDANRQLTSPLFIPQAVHGSVVELNRDLSYEEETQRYNSYFLDFMTGVLYLHQRISCHFWFSIQSFPAASIFGTDLIISYYTNDKLAEKFMKKFEDRGYRVVLNHPDYDGKQLFGYTNTTFLNGFYPRKRESLIFVISSKQLSENLDKVKKDFSELIKLSCIKDD